MLLIFYLCVCFYQFNTQVNSTLAETYSENLVAAFSVRPLHQSKKKISESLLLHLQLSSHLFMYVVYASELNLWAVDDHNVKLKLRWRKKEFCLVSTFCVFEQPI